MVMDDLVNVLREKWLLLLKQKKNTVFYWEKNIQHTVNGMT